MIHFNVPPFTGKEFDYMQEAVSNHKICGDGVFTKKCNEWMEERFNANKVMLTTSGSTALDMAALLCGLKPEDEVILPSFTFSSTANSFVLAGAKLVFVDIRPDTMNINEKKIEKIRTNSRLALSSDFRVLVETTGIEPAKIIFHSKFPKTITISSRNFSVIYKLTITYKI